MTKPLILLLTVISVVLLTSIYVYLIFQKTRNQWHRKRKARWLEAHSKDIERYLFTGEGPITFAPTKRYHYEVLEDTFSSFLDNYKPETGMDPIRDVVDEYFVPWYTKRLKSPQWSIRMNTLFFIDLFAIQEMQDVLVEHASSKLCTPEERYEIYLMLAKIEYEGLLELLKNSPHMPAFLLNELMYRLVNQENADQFVDSFDQFDESWRGAILDVVREKHLRSIKLQQWLEDLMVSDHDELRVKALKAIASLGYVSSVDWVVQWLRENVESGKWENARADSEKLMAARLMGNIRHEKFIPFLVQLLGDSVYHVRSEAAKAIRKYKQGRDILLSMASTHPDRFARSISQEWVERSLDYE